MTCDNHWHRTYSLTCEQFAELRAFTGGLCNICGMREHYTPNGFYIDHDHALGMWAVRGLLCPRCNTLIEKPGELVGPERDDYLARPWHIRAGLVPAAPIVRRPSREDREAFLEQLRGHRERFMNLRRNPLGVTATARQYADENMVPLVLEAKAMKISARWVAAASGYSEQSIYKLWSRAAA